MKKLLNDDDNTQEHQPSTSRRKQQQPKSPRADMNVAVTQTLEEGSNLSIHLSSAQPSQQATKKAISGSESNRRKNGSLRDQNNNNVVSKVLRPVKSNEAHKPQSKKSNRKESHQLRNHGRKSAKALKPVVLPRKRYGRRGLPLLEPNTRLLDSYVVTKMFGGGGFGQVYRAYNEDRQLTVAVKVEPKDHDPGRMILEQKVLSLLKGTPNAPILYASGSYGPNNFIIMEILGPNLSDIRKRYKGQCLTLGSALRTMLQASTSLRTLHEIGYIHRDVKPSNFCIGLAGAQKRIIYLVDFGLSRQFRDNKGKLRKQRRVAAFRGTLKYVSINVHSKKEQGPVDDFISLFYTGFELSEGALPWRSEKDAIMVEQMKRNFKYEECAKRLPRTFKKFYDYLQPLTYKSQLNYEQLQMIIKDSIPEGINDKTLYDWEDPTSTDAAATIDQ